jgi:hypothetical protein
MAIVCLIYALSAIMVVPNELNIPAGGSFDFIGSFLGVSGLILIFFSLKYLNPRDETLMKVLDQPWDGTGHIRIYSSL